MGSFGPLILRVKLLLVLSLTARIHHPKIDGHLPRIRCSATL